MKLYIDWEDEIILPATEEAKEKWKREWIENNIDLEDRDLEHYLIENYTTMEVFNMEDDKKMKVYEEYKEWLAEQTEEDNNKAERNFEYCFEEVETRE